MGSTTTAGCRHSTFGHHSELGDEKSVTDHYAPFSLDFECAKSF